MLLICTDNLCRFIEEIFSTRFLKETNALKANISKGENTARENVQIHRNKSFSYFVYEFIKEKTKGTKNFEQVSKALGLIKFFLGNIIISL